MQSKINQSKKPKAVDQSEVLWLASWYPNALDAYTGDFIQRHARAFAITRPLQVLHIAKDDKGLFTQSVKTVNTTVGYLTETIIYYHPPKVGIALLNRLISTFFYLRVGKKWLKNYLASKNTPVLVEVAVAMRAGILALWLKRKYGLRYVVKEHWTGYYRESIPPGQQQSRLFWKLTTKILANAEGLITDSRDLGRHIKETLLPIDFTEIPNVVDTDLFFYKPKPAVSNKCFVFLHASTMGYQKNTEAIIRQFLRLRQVNFGYSLQLRLLGPDTDNLQQAFGKAWLESNGVVFAGNVSYPEVARQMQQADAFVLFSRFENLPCVVLEALCCGLPVIATRVGGIAHHLSPDAGILVDSENEEQLYQAMEKLASGTIVFNRPLISTKAAHAYSMQQINFAYHKTYEKYFKK
jgi:glycosyltransferase involved in cell wall biosynthesis